MSRVKIKIILGGHYLPFLADRTIGLVFATMFCPSVCLSSVTYVLWPNNLPKTSEEAKQEMAHDPAGVERERVEGRGVKCVVGISTNFTF